MIDVEKLVRAAKEARERAYAPYSGFKVGAAVLGESGQIYAGCNIENAAYSATVCAERVAVGAAVSAGERAISAVAVVADGPEPCFPCGSCRQVLQEFAADTKVIVADLSGNTQVLELDELLPHAFGPPHLGGVSSDGGLA